MLLFILATGHRHFQMECMNNIRQRALLLIARQNTGALLVAPFVTIITIMTSVAVNTDACRKDPTGCVMLARKKNSGCSLIILLISAHLKERYATSSIRQHIYHYDADLV